MYHVPESQCKLTVSRSRQTSCIFDSFRELIEMCRIISTIHFTTMARRNLLRSDLLDKYNRLLYSEDCKGSNYVWGLS